MSLRQAQTIECTYAFSLVLRMLTKRGQGLRARQVRRRSETRPNRVTAPLGPFGDTAEVFAPYVLVTRVIRGPA